MITKFGFTPGEWQQTILCLVLAFYYKEEI